MVRVLKKPEIITELPGPKAKKILEKDKKYVSPSYPRAYPFVMEKGEGIWVWDVDGNKFMDMNAGIAVVATGHSHPEIVKVIREQSSKFIHMSGSDFYYEEMVELAEKLAEIVPGAKNRKVFFTNSGTEAVETAIKLSRYTKRRPIFLSFINSFHGRTMGSLSLTSSKEVQRKYFAPNIPVFHIPFPNPYRPPLGAKRENVSDVVIEYLEETVLKKLAPPEDVAAFFIEPIQGEGGYVVPPMDFFQKLKNLLDKYEILLVDDEVQSGMGRTGKMFAIEHWGVIPDIVTIAKGIASGLPLGATVARSSLMEWEKGSHANTFGGNPLACAAALKTIELLEGGLVENARKVGDHLIRRLKEIAREYEIIGDVRGLGLMVGVEIVKERKSKERAPKLAKKIVLECFRRGLLLLIAGENVIRWSPPLVVKEEEIDLAVEIFEDALRTVLSKK